MEFDLEGARKAGATDDQIAQALAERTNFDLQGALDAGASHEQVIGAMQERLRPMRPLPDGMTPSDAGAGRGRVVPHGPTLRERLFDPHIRTAPAHTPRRGGRSEVRPFVATGRDTTAADVGNAVGGAIAGTAGLAAEKALGTMLDLQNSEGREPEPPVLDNALERPAAYTPTRTELLAGQSLRPDVAQQIERDARPPAEAKPFTTGQNLAADVREATKNPVARGVAQGVGQIGQIGPGALRMAADFFGSEKLGEFASAAGKTAGQFTAGATSDLRGGEKLVADVTGSIFNSAPSMALGVVGGPALKTLFVQSTLSEYNAGRDAGFGPEESLQRAGIMGAAEAIGERFGFPQQIALLKSLAKHVPTDSLSKVFGEMLAKEIPGEQLTTLMQFLADKAGPAALNPNATLGDYLNQAGETLKVTIGQTAVMGGGPATIGATRNALRSADQTIAKTREADPDPALILADAINEASTQFGLSTKAAVALRDKANTMPAQQAADYVARALDGFERAGMTKKPGAAQGFRSVLEEKAQAAQDEAEELAAEQPTQPASTEPDFTGLDTQPQPQEGTDEVAAQSIPSSEARVGVPAPSADTPIEGEPINRNWSAFTPESGTLGIPREQMPQVKAEHRGALTNFLNARGITHESGEVPAASLKPSQAEFSPRKVKQAAEFTGGDRAILVSADDHIIDGHHQWLAKREAGEPVRIIRLGAPAQDILRLAHQFPSSTTSGGPRARNGTGHAEPAGTPAGGPADDGASGGTEPLVQGELQQPVPAGPAGPAVPGAGQRDVPEPTRPGDGDGALSAGDAVTLDDKPFTIKSASPKVIRLTGENGKVRVITSDSANWPKIKRATAPIRNSQIAEEFAGQMGEGMAEHVAKSHLSRLKRERPDLEWSIAEADPARNPKLKADRYVVQGRTPDPQAQATQAGAQAGGVEPTGATGEAGAAAAGSAPVEADGVKALSSDDIPRGPKGDQMLRDMPIGTKDEAAAFLVAYKAWLAANNPYGMVRGVHDKPATLRAPDLSEKARVAAETAEANYWQMPYETARAMYDFKGLPREKWEAERKKRGLPVGGQKPESSTPDASKDAEESNTSPERVEEPAASKQGTPADGLKAQAARKAAPKARTKTASPVMGSMVLGEIVHRLGGIGMGLRSDLSSKAQRERTSKTGKKTTYTAWRGDGLLFRAGGTTDLNEIARVLEEAGYLEPGTLERDYLDANAKVQDIIKAEIANPGSTQRIDADGVEATMRQRQENASFEAEQRAAADLDEWLHGELDVQAANPPADQEVQNAGLELAALLADAAQAGVDVDLLKERFFDEADPDWSQETYETNLAQAIRDGAARARSQAGGDDARAARGSDPVRGEAGGDQSGPAGERADGPDQTVRPEEDRPGLDLTAETEADAQAKADREAEALAAEKKAKDAEQARLKKADDERETRARADSSVDDFQLGQSAEQQLSGQQDIFSAPAPAPSTAPAAPEAQDPSAEPAPEPEPEPADILEAEAALWSSITDGKASVEEFKAGFERWVSSKADILAAFSKKKKDDLLKMGGSMFAYRYKSETKPEIVEALWREGASGYSLGRGITYGMGKDSYINAIRQMVDTTDADRLAEFAAERKAATEEAVARAARTVEAIKDPKTLEEFRAFTSHHMRAGKTAKEARFMLTPEQRARVDDLWATETRGSRKATTEVEKTKVRVAGQTVDGDIIATKHTKKGHDLFVVQLAERVSREDYETLNAGAKRIGGYYSSFRGGGAIPGFQFTTREQAQAFVTLAQGDNTAAIEAAQERRDAFADDRSQSAVERLNEMADRLEDQAQESMGRERKANTERRARFAANAEAAAREQQALAKTVRNIASAIESGKAKFLDRVRQKAQVELLQRFVANAKGAELRAKYDSYTEQQKHVGEPATGETADFAEFPSFTAYRSDLASLGRQLLEADGTKLLGQKILKVADDVSDAFTKWAKEDGNLHRLATFSTKDGKRPAFSTKDEAERVIERSGYRGKAIAWTVKRGEHTIIMSPSEAIARGIWKGDGDKRIGFNAEFGTELVEKIGRAARRGSKVSVPWQFETAHDRLKALGRMGIETPAEFRAALREFIGLREQAAAPDKVKQLERAMVGRRNDGFDFFPTPESTADEMVAAAGIEPGMRVLEPSAGMGHIAERIRAAGAEPVVGEIAEDRRELLEAKGFELVGRDFMDMTDGGFDRIVMNPPFSDGRDIQHVRHAYDLLKPGGRLVAIMGESAFTNQNKRATEFRAWLDEIGGTEEKLAEGTFLDPSLPVNTGANARMVVIDKAEAEAGGPGATALKRGTARRGMPLAEAQETVRQLEAVGVRKIHVVDSVADMPAARRDRILAKDEKGEARGAYFPTEDEVWLVASNLRNADELIFVALHEAFHRGLQVTFGAEGAKLLRQIYATNKRIRDLADGYMARYKIGQDEAVNEALADLAGSGEVRDIRGWNRLLKMIRDWLGKIADALGVKLKFTDEMVDDLIMGLTRAGLQDQPAVNIDTTGPQREAAQQAIAERVQAGQSFAEVTADIALSRKPSYTTEQRSALDKAGMRGPKSLKGKVQSAYSRVLSVIQDRGQAALEARQGLLDQFAGLQNAIRRDVGNLPVEQDPYVSARLANGGTSSVMRGLLLHGQAQWAKNGQHLEKKDGTKGLLDILKPLGDDLEAWFGWMIGNRAARLMKEGREHNFTPDDIKALQSLATPEKKAAFQKAALEYAAFKRSVLDVAQEAGLIDGEARKAWDYADYIPFYREVDEKAAFSPTGRRGLAGQSSGVRTLKGGESELNDPMENLLMNFSRLIDASLKNNALRKTVDLLVAHDSDAVHKIGYAMKGDLIPAEQIRKRLVEAGTPQQVLDVIPPEAFDGMAKMWAIQAPSDPDVIRLMANGKPQFYRVNDPVLLASLTSFVPFDFPGLGMMRWFKRVLTSTVTAAPDFVARNFIRDTAAAQMITRDGFHPGKSFAGVVKAMKEQGGFEQMLFAGASFQSGNINALDPEATGRAMRRALRQRGLSAAAADGFMASVIDTPVKLWEKYRHLSESIENANREAVFEAAGKAGKSPTAAAYEAKDLMDFSLRGSWAAYSLLADTVPFLNARVQGLYRLGRSNPRRIAVTGLVMMAASLMLMAANADNDDYEALPDWDKDSYWHFWIGGEHFRLPKPFELGVVFATIPERIMRLATGKDGWRKFGHRVLENMGDQLAFDPVPQAIRPIMNVWANTDTFRDMPIESQSDEGKPPHLRYSANTSPTARELLDLLKPGTDPIGLSPKKFEYLVNAYTGAAGFYALSLSDMAVRQFDGSAPRPAMRADDIPLVKAFYRVDPGRSTVWESDFYEMRHAVDEIYRGVQALKREGDLEKAQSLTEENLAKLRARKVLDDAAKRLAAINKNRDRIYADQTVSKDEKRQQLDELYQQKAEVARAAVEHPAVVEAF